MSFDWWTFALQAVNFLILAWLLQRFLFKPVKAIVARRKEEISRALSEASAQRESVERLTREIEAKKSEVDGERQRMIDAERTQLSAERQKMIEEARQETVKIREQALKRLDEERTAAGNELFERTVILATNLAERLLRELAAPSIDQQFLRRVIDYLDRMPAEERARLFPRTRTDALSVTTAFPLGDREQSQWREQLAERFGPDFAIKFDADPALIAGAIIAFPHAILRFNWRDNIATALKELHADGQSR
jgi:F-type H+-transporting ATPase subunit b